MIRKILTGNNKILRTPSKEVVFPLSKEAKETLEDLLETVKTQKDPEGQGLAAPQIGKSLGIFVMQKDKVYREAINPKIIKKSKETNFFTLGKDKCILEGCLSVPDVYGELERPYKVEVIYFDKRGKEIKETLEGMASICFQHEFDHLEGVLFIDKVLEQGGKLFEIEGENWKEIIL